VFVVELLGEGVGVLERVDELEIDGVSDAVLVVLSVGVGENDGELVRLGVDEGESVVGRWQRGMRQRGETGASEKV
jgi:hypothetical protein